MSDACLKDCIMRSELVEFMGKCKFINEMPAGRRKLQATKATVITNGESSASCSKVDAVEDADFSDNNRSALSLSSSTNNKLVTEVNMVAAMQDHISCTKLKSSGSVESEKDLTKMTFELDHMYANCSSGVRLNNAAVSLSSSAASSADEHPLSDDDTQQIQTLKELIILTLDLISQEQEKSNFKDLQIAELKKENEALKQQLREVEKYRRKSMRKLKSGDGASDSDSPSGGDGYHWGDHSQRHLERRRKRLNAREESHLEEHLRQHKKRRRKSLEEKHNWALSTDLVYYTPVGEVTRTEEESINPDDVQVPNWRVKVVTSCYQMEGTENLDDDIYLKRHQKLEVDEKRRKRWDIQRIREQRMQERLRRGRQAKKKTKPTKNPTLETFYPNIDDIHILEVCDVLPVSAFGRPVTKNEDDEFSLPWGNG